MISARKVDDEEDARRCLAAAERASISPRERARRNGVDSRSLNAWRIKLGRGRAIAKVGPAALTLVDVVARPASTAPAAWVSAARYLIEVDGARFDFGDGVSGVSSRCCGRAASSALGARLRRRRARRHAGFVRRGTDAGTCTIRVVADLRFDYDDVDSPVMQS